MKAASAYQYRRGPATTYLTVRFVEEWVDDPHNAKLAADEAGIRLQRVTGLPRDSAMAVAARRNGHGYLAISTGASDEALRIWAADQDAVEEYRVEPLEAPAPQTPPARRRR